MGNKKALKIGTNYKCKIKSAFAESHKKPEWSGKVATLKYTGLFFRSLKDDSLFFAVNDVEIIEEIKG